MGIEQLIARQELNITGDFQVERRTASDDCEVSLCGRFKTGVCEEMREVIERSAGLLNTEHADLLNWTLLDPASDGPDQNNTPEVNGKISTWYVTHGQGPTFFGKVRSSLSTITELAVGTVAPYACVVDGGDPPNGVQTMFVNGGTQLSGGDVYKFVEGLKEIGSTHKVNHLCSFYAARNCDINGKTLDVVKQTIEMSAEFFDLTLPIVIPVTFQGESLWERNHIAVILVKDGCVEYYDPKGVVSGHKILGDKIHTMRDVLDYCQETFAPQGSIVENPHVHQLDCHKCGVYVCHFLYERLVQGTSMGTLSPTPPKDSDIVERRLEILRIAHFMDSCAEQASGINAADQAEDDF